MGKGCNLVIPSVIPVVLLLTQNLTLVLGHFSPNHVVISLENYLLLQALIHQTCQKPSTCQGAPPHPHLRFTAFCHGRVRMGFAVDLQVREELAEDTINGMHVGSNANSRHLINRTLLSLVKSSLLYADNSKIAISSLDLSLSVCLPVCIRYLCIIDL